MTSHKITHEVLNSYFEETNHKFNIDYFTHYFEVSIYNDREYIEEIRKSKRKVYSIVWFALLDHINQMLKYNDYGNYTCTSQQLKNYFNSYGLDYKMAVKPLIDIFENERKEYN